MADLGVRLTSRLTARWWAGAIALLALLLSGLVIGVVGQAERSPSATDSLPIGSDSSAAAALRERLPQQDESSAVVLFSRDGTALSDADRTAIGTKVQSLTNAQGGKRLPVVPSADGTAQLVVVPVAAADATRAAEVVRDLRDVVKAGLPSGLTAQVTGPAAVEADLAAVFEGANVRLLITTASIVALLLVITYRSPVLWLIPLTIIGVADRLAAVLATQVLHATGVVWDESTIGILSVLVFGAGTDYALLLISRYRDELRRHEDRREAMALALRRTAEAVLSSATTVVVAVLTLLLSAFPGTRGLGLASAVGVATAAGFVLIVLPAALVVFGRWVFWPKVPHVGEASLADARTPWRRIGEAVAARPMRVIAATLVGLGIAAALGTGISTGLSTAEQFLDKPEAISAAERLAQSFPAGSADPAVVVTTAEAQGVLDRVSGSTGVTSARVTAQGNGVTQIDAVLAGAPGSDEVRSSVSALRDHLSGLPDTHVGGTEAAALDTASASRHDRSVILPLILGLVLVALVLLLRSLVAPVVLVATVLLTYVASLGLSWLVFTQWLGFARLDDSAPLLSFVFLVALGVDYNIFLVTRAREEAQGHGTRSGMVRGLAATGGVITSAGVLLAAVFAVLGVLPLVVLAQVGVIICIGVLLDTLVVRTLLVPALAIGLGDAFWWPRRRSGAEPLRPEPVSAPVKAGGR
ncbi:MMPL family transporter [Intrasporangium chromatireducens]|uniref:MMPL family transporter n=1 Tax=Intrasporangium chromatireducens TaxID=1386088 RepID=UPI0004B39C44|nr:MMPL family transporter [Intrasporangium chromatireducens]